MKLATAVIVISALVTGQAIAAVKGTTGASGYAPGQKMQDKGSVKGTTGASGYAPGHADDKKK